MNKRVLLYLILNAIIFAGFAYVGDSNFHLLLAHNPKMSPAELFYLLVSVAALSMVFGIYLMTFSKLRQEKTIKEYKRELERRGIDKDKNSSKVKVLESKIVVLEKALEESLKNKDN